MGDVDILIFRLLIHLTSYCKVLRPNLTVFTQVIVVLATPIYFVPYNFCKAS